MTDNKLKEIKTSLELRKIGEEACYGKVTSELKNTIDLYNEVIDCHDNKNSLIKHLEEKTKECKNTIDLLEGTNSFRISILNQQINIYQDILERVKSGKYE